MRCRILIGMDWEAIQPRLADWEKKRADFLPLVGAWAGATPCSSSMTRHASSSSATSPSRPNTGLTNGSPRTTCEQGDTAHWLATLDQYLAAGEDHGLDHATGPGRDRQLLHG